MIHETAGIAINVGLALTGNSNIYIYDPNHPLSTDGKYVASCISNGHWLLWAGNPRRAPVHKPLQYMLRRPAGLRINEKFKVSGLSYGEVTVRHNVSDFRDLLPRSGSYRCASLTDYQMRSYGVLLDEVPQSNVSTYEWHRHSVKLKPQPQDTAGYPCVTTGIMLRYFVAFAKMDLMILLRVGGTTLDPMLLARQLSKKDGVEPCGAVMPMRI